jgi:hypothetical protein
VSSNSLEHQLDVVLENIRSHLFAEATSPYELTPQFFYKDIGGTKTRILLNPNTRVMELSLNEFLWHNPQTDWSVRGAQFNGRIFLRKYVWCKGTLFHESLHTVEDIELINQPELLQFSEGLTRFFTVYLAYKNNTYCYNAWIDERYSICSITHKPWVKTFGAFCKFLPITLFKNLYFHDGIRWIIKYNHFLDAIHNGGYPDFEDIFQNKKRGKLSLYDIFLQECSKNFKKRFQNIYQSDKEALDFTNIIE